jgi:prophage regulatory protein
MPNQADSSHAQPVPRTASVEVKAVRFIRLPEVIHVAGMSRSQVYRLVAAGKFPQPVKLGQSASAWVEAEVAQWCADRIAASREATA